MNATPLVSTIVIFLNEERFLQEAVESIIAQTYDHWELVLVDDGSIDGSSEMARHYAQLHPEKISYLEHEGHQNRGMSASRNLGIQHTKGKYVAFLDADDVWLPRKLEQQVEILRTHPQAALVCGRTQWWYSWTGKTEDTTRDLIQHFDTPLDTIVEPPIVLRLFLQNEWASLCDIMVRREAVERIGGYEESFRGMYEDQAFHAKLCLKWPVFVSHECWYRYRQHADACTAQSHRAGQFLAIRKAFLHWLVQYLLAHRVTDLMLWNILLRELVPLHYPRLHHAASIAKRTGRQLASDSRRIAKQKLPARFHTWAWTQWKKYRVWPPVGWVRFGHLRRRTPFSPMWPNRRGSPVDRYYIERFLATHADAIQGRVLELGDASYTWRFGGKRVTQSDVLHGRPDNPGATIVADLTAADHIPSDTFDCIILTQTLLLIYDVRAALATLFRILKPGGVLLVTVPGITHTVREDREEYGQYWSFTTQSMQRLLGEVFPEPNVCVEAYGNVVVVTAFLYGLAIEDLRQSELDYQDYDYELIIGARAMKPRMTGESIRV